ncbi:hypothetical protein K1719_024566 [Acacia pycnantha]|nr:hypothetical protein K1719_024566 [Acacia pycnantha]
MWRLELAKIVPLRTFYFLNQRSKCNTVVRGPAFECAASGPEDELAGQLGLSDGWTFNTDLTGGRRVFPYSPKFGNY